MHSTDMMIMTTYDDENLMENIGGDKTCPKVWLELFCQVFFWAEVRPRRHLNCTPEIGDKKGENCDKRKYEGHLNWTTDYQLIK